jgi:hypothetical protein
MNGVKLQNGIEVSATNGSTFTILTNTPANGTVIEVVGIAPNPLMLPNSSYSGTSTVVSQQFTANGSANSFTVSGGYTAGTLQVYLNGVKQIPGVDVITTSGSTVNFVVTPANNYIIDVFGYLTSIVYSANAFVVGNTQIGINSIILNNTTIGVNNVATNTVIANTINANGSVGTNGQVLTSNGSASYWSTISANSTDVGLGSTPASQSWQNVTSNRSAGTTYTNSTGKPIFVTAYATQTGYVYTSATVGGQSISTQGSGAAGYSQFSSVWFVVPTGNTYSISITNGSLSGWYELR